VAIAVRQHQHRAKEDTMSTTFTVGYLVGSLSSTSINRALATALQRRGVAHGLELREVPIAPLPFYSPDLDGDFPQAAQDFKSALDAVDAVMLVTPEYNRSVPGVLKNALDFVSRPRGRNSFAGKPSAVIGTSVGPIGTAVAQQHLRSILSFLASPELAQPEAYIQTTEGLITPEGEVTNERTAAFLDTWLTAFHAHTAKSLAPVS
jgi:chromate reductase